MAVRQKITGRRSIVGTIGDKALHRTINLIQKISQGCGITDIVCGQIGANDLAADKIKTNVKLAPFLPFDFDFVLVFQPFALTKDLQAVLSTTR